VTFLGLFDVPRSHSAPPQWFRAWGVMPTLTQNRRQKVFIRGALRLCGGALHLCGGL